MTEDEKYLFDLNGYLVIEDVLSPAELALANEAVDKYGDRIKPHPDSLAGGSPTLAGQRTRGELHDVLGLEDPYGPVFRRILTHPRLVPYLNEILGKGFRVDHLMFLLTMDAGTEGFYMHGAAGQDFDPSEYYTFKNGKLYCGLSVVAVQLHDVNPGDGGFVVVPGSHKANFNAPQSLSRFEKYQDNVRQICCRAGSAVIFYRGSDSRHTAVAGPTIAAHPAHALPSRRDGICAGIRSAGLGG
jgi:hypothetical protein